MKYWKKYNKNQNINIYIYIYIYIYKDINYWKQKENRKKLNYKLKQIQNI